MAANRFAIVVPCHRVINADGSLGNYGARGGKQTKRRLLEMEERALESAGQVAKPARRRIRRATAKKRG
jgi:alkylated DNA nucleotide flippase Atl1